MTPTSRAIVAAARLARPTSFSAQVSAVITKAEIDGHVRFLSSELLGRRAPATRGGCLAAEYIASQWRAAGVDGTLLANSPAVPTWNKDAELHMPRAMTQP